MRRTRRRHGLAWLAPLCALGLLVTPQAFAPSASATNATGFVSFREFRSQLNAATFASVESRGAVAASPQAFAQMQTYLQTLYAHVDVRTSFVTDGAYFDCVTLMSQPGVAKRGIKHIATPPPASAVLAHAGDAHAWTTKGTDARGAVVSCPAATVPMRRITLSEVARYKTLRTYLSRAQSSRATVTTSDYRYAHAFQLVNNHGSFSLINVWNPKVPVGTGGDDHSLSQQWVTGGSGTNLQTAEAGWTKDPNFSTAKPIFFTYFTADGYNTTGCYNLECAAFVQTNTSVALGAPVSPCCSTQGKVDDSFSEQYLLSGGNWWLIINGTQIGYFPTSIYDGGQMSRNATEVDYGGEVNASLHTAKWPQMGSGKPASAGFEHAAYQSSIQYIGMNGKAKLASLTPQATSPCYTISYGPASGKTPAFFYFGGKGGKPAAC